MRCLQPTKMVVISSEICSKLQPRTTEPLYSTLFCMRCQRGAGPSLCESWQNFHPLGFHDATQGLSRSLMITVYFYPIYSLQKTFRHPKRTCNVDYTQECRPRTTSEQHPADSFSAGSQRPTPAGQQQCLEPAFLHGFARTCHTNHDT